MPVITIPDDYYTFDASARTITLTGVHRFSSTGDIISIRNTTTGEVIYDSTVWYGPNVAHITVSDGVITYNAGNTAHSDTDKLQIKVSMRYVAQDHNELRMIEGDMFRNGQYMSIADAGSDYILIKVGAKCPHVLFSAQVNGDTQIEIYQTPTVTANGTEMLSGNFNLNYLLTKLAVTKLYYAPTVTDEGTYLANTWAFGGSGSAPGVSVKVTDSIEPIRVILVPNTDYLLKFNNNAARTLQVWFEIDFFECEV